MQLLSKANGGLIEVEDELGAELLASGQWAKPRRRSAPKHRASEAPARKAPATEE